MYHKQFKNGIAFAILIWSLDMLCLYLTGRFLDNEYVYWGLRIIPVAAVVLVAYVQNHDLKSLGFYPDHLKHDGIVMLCYSSSNCWLEYTYTTCLGNTQLATGCILSFGLYCRRSLFIGASFNLICCHHTSAEKPAI